MGCDETQERILPTFVASFFSSYGVDHGLFGSMVGFCFKRNMLYGRTNKFVLAKMPNIFKGTYKELLLGSWFLIGIIEAFLMGGRIVTKIIFLIASSVCFVLLC